MQPGTPDLAPGTVIGGDFRIVGPLSAGGMGAVYVAEQLSTGKRRALKVMHPSMVQDTTLRDRFAQEARVGALIASDHVVEVVGAGIDPATGAPWIAMELLDGENLAAHIAHRGPLSPEELVALFRPLCHALGAAHASGVVHRDIKPENIFMAKTHSTAAPISLKVLDFGIAKLTAQAHSTFTATMGTPAWMAPEQSEMGARITPATDVWALGLLAFWALTGRLYWRAAGGAVPSVHTLLREMLFEPIVPASERAREFGAAERLPPGFDAWFARAVVREPDARFPDANVAFRELVSGFGLELGSSPYVSPVATALPSSPSHPPPSAFQPTFAQVTQGPTQVPLVSVVPPPQRRSSCGIWIGLGGVLVALLAVIGAVAVFFWFARESGSASVVAPTATAASPVLESATPAASLSAPSSSAGPGPRAPRPAGSVSVSAPASAAEPPKKPFNMTAALKAVNANAQTAKALCKHLDGPAAMSASVNFKNDGSVKSTQADVEVRVTARGNCALGTLGSSRIEPFDGPSSPVPVSVVF